MNAKDARILKLDRAGLTKEQIARKIGQPGPTGVARVEAALKRSGARARLLAEDLSSWR
jgi:hypothetical protein